MTDAIAVAELCAGYGGWFRALQLLGLPVRLAWVADNDPRPSIVLAHRYPETPNHGDITTIGVCVCGAPLGGTHADECDSPQLAPGARQWTDLEPVDILAAGFPCQDISSAGRQAGIEGSRSGIWANIAEAIRVLRPRLVLLENVSALLFRGMGRVLGDLAAAGYVGSWRCIRASDVGAPHQRDRVFILARPAANTNSPLGRYVQPRSGPRTIQGPEVNEWPPVQSGRRDSRNRHQGALAESALDHHVDQDLWGKFAPALIRWAEVIGRPLPHPTELGNRGQHRLAPRFVEWMLGLPAGEVTDLVVPDADPRPNKLSRGDALHTLGNGIVPQQAAEAIARLMADIPDEE